MSFLKGLVIGIFISAVAYFVMTLSQKPPDRDQLSVNSVNPTLGTKYGEAVFHEAAYQAIKGKSFQETCAMADLHRKIFCEEGFYFVKFSNDINKISHNLDSNTISKAIHIETAVQAVSFGMALAVRLLSIDSYKGPDQEVYQPYIEDGWGFNFAFQNYDPTYPFKSICSQLPNKKYCEFGVGRALFFKGFSADKALDISPYALKGLQFATIYAEKDDVKPSMDVPIQEFAYSLKNWKKVPNKSVDCVLKQRKHFVVCMEEKAY